MASKASLIGVVILSSYIIIVSFLAAYEDSKFHQRTIEESSIRIAYRSNHLDLLEYAMAGPNASDPCPYVSKAAERLEHRRGSMQIYKAAPGRHLISATEFRERFSQDNLPKLMNGVPKVIHQTWWSRKVKDRNLRLSASWLRCMPDWIHVLWDDDESMNLFQDYRAEMVDMLNGYPYAVQRSDMFRYLVLYVYGGLYVDMDYECVADISGDYGIGSSHASVFMSAAPNPSVDGLAQNTLMASIAGDRFWLHVLNVASASCGRMYEPELLIRMAVATNLCAIAYRLRVFFGWTGISVLSTTGPRMLSFAYSTYPEQEKQRIILLDVDSFNGQMDRGSKDGEEFEDRVFACATHAIHRNSAGWTKNSPFPYTGDHTILGKRIPHRLIAILIIEVAVLLVLLQCCLQQGSTILNLRKERKQQ